MKPVVKTDFFEKNPKHIKLYIYFPHVRRLPEKLTNEKKHLEQLWVSIGK